MNEPYTIRRTVNVRQKLVVTFSFLAHSFQEIQTLDVILCFFLLVLFPCRLYVFALFGDDVTATTSKLHVKSVSVSDVTEGLHSEVGVHVVGYSTIRCSLSFFPWCSVKLYECCVHRFI